jgi:hypothetical protein
MSFHVDALHVRILLMTFQAFFMLHRHVAYLSGRQRVYSSQSSEVWEDLQAKQQITGAGGTHCTWANQRNLATPNFQGCFYIICSFTSNDSSAMFLLHIASSVVKVLLHNV